MSKTVQITSTSQFRDLLSSSSIVVADFYADWCGPCRQIAPIYEQLSAQLSRPNKITFTKINTDQQKELSQQYDVRAMPTFMIFKNQTKIEGIEGADARKLSAAVERLAKEANRMEEGGEGSGEASTGGTWFGAALPKGYEDVTGSIDVQGMEMLNWDSDKGNARTLFGGSKPKGPEADDKDFVQSDADEQLMIYVPFQSTLKIHSIHITSQPAPSADDDDEMPSRPTVVKLFINRPSALSFDDAESSEATQQFALQESDWDAKTGTARLDLRFVKFQNVSSLIMFVAESAGDNEKVRLDRVRIIGETGERRDGKIEKIASDE